MATTCELIATTTLGSDTTSVTFTSIPQTYTDLYCVVSARSSHTSATAHYRSFLVYPNGSSSNGSRRDLYAVGSTAGSQSGADLSFGIASNSSATADTFGSTEIYIPNYAGSTNKSISLTGVAESNNASYNGIFVSAGLWSDTSAITSLELNANTPSGTQFKAGSSFFLYGITKA